MDIVGWCLALTGLVATVLLVFKQLRTTPTEASEAVSALPRQQRRHLRRQVMRNEHVRTPELHMARAMAQVMLAASRTMWSSLAVICIVAGVLLNDDSQWGWVRWLLIGAAGLNVLPVILAARVRHRSRRFLGATEALGAS